MLSRAQRNQKDMEELKVETADPDVPTNLAEIFGEPVKIKPGQVVFMDESICGTDRDVANVDVFDQELAEE